MRYRLRCAGVTLLEVLAAIVLLSLISVAVIPLFLQMGRNSAELEGSIEGEAILQDELARIWLPNLTTEAGKRPLAAHPGWTMYWEPLVHQPSGYNGTAVVSRRWIYFYVQGPGAGAFATCVRPVPAGGAL